MLACDNRTLGSCSARSTSQGRGIGLADMRWVALESTFCMHGCCWRRSRAEAWRIGAEIAAQVTAANPPPVTLKLEKVHSRRIHLA
jgi:hypothetical protein